MAHLLEFLINAFIGNPNESLILDALGVDAKVSEFTHFSFFQNVNGHLPGGQLVPIRVCIRIYLSSCSG
jgi:hypothetical protein